MSDTTVARRYARGLLRAVLDMGVDGQDPGGVAGQLQELSATVRGHSGLQSLVVSPAVETESKASVLREIGERLDVGEVVLRFLDVLADNDRIDHIHAIAATFSALVDEHRGVINAEVTAPQELGDDAIRDLRDKLQRATGREVRLRTRRDPALLGGLVTRIGDVVYDGSLRHHLAEMRDQMIDS